MRRKDRAMNIDFALDLLDSCAYGVLSMGKANEAYGIPISYVRVKDILYMHGATAGKKIDWITKQPNCSFTVVGEVRVPELYTKDELKSYRETGKIDQIVSRVYTTEFSSAIASGFCRIVAAEAEKRLALTKLCEKYTPDKMADVPAAIDASLERTGVIAFQITELTGKRKRYDKQGKEMKWGRME